MPCHSSWAHSHPFHVQLPMPRSNCQVEYQVGSAPTQDLSGALLRLWAGKASESEGWPIVLYFCLCICALCCLKMLCNWQAMNSQSSAVATCTATPARVPAINLCNSTWIAGKPGTGYCLQVSNEQTNAEPKSSLSYFGALTCAFSPTGFFSFSSQRARVWEY